MRTNWPRQLLRVESGMCGGGGHLVTMNEHRASGVIALLRASAAARSVAYFSSMVGVLLSCFRLPHDPENAFDEHVHPQAFPGVVAITDLFTRLQSEDRAAWTWQPTAADLTDLARGIALGTATSSAVLSIGMAKGWMSAPAWGWERGLKRETVLAAVALKASQEAVLVFN